MDDSGSRYRSRSPEKTASPANSTYLLSPPSGWKVLTEGRTSDIRPFGIPCAPVRGERVVPDELVEVVAVEDAVNFHRIQPAEQLREDFGVGEAAQVADTGLCAGTGAEDAHLQFEVIGAQAAVDKRQVCDE